MTRSQTLASLAVFVLALLVALSPLDVAAAHTVPMEVLA